MLAAIFFMETDELIRKSLRVSFASFIFGTALLVFFVITNSYFFAVASLPVICILGVVNFVLLWRLGLNGLNEKENRKRLFLTGGVISLNIPVVFIYSYFVLVLTDTVIVRFKNDTDTTLTNISVIGCDERTIQDLQPGQTEIEWIPITKDCIEKRIILQYEVSGTVQKEIVYGYVIDGQRINHKIGNNKLIVGE
jgi:hypothetical protein